MAKLPNEQGIALIIVLSVISIFMILMTEIITLARLHQATTNIAANNLQAYYSALSGIKLDSLFITLHGKIKNEPQIKQVLGKQTALLDLIWQIGFLHPLPILEEEIVSHEPSKLIGNIKVTNEDVTSHINLNLLGSSEEKEREYVKYLLKNIFKSQGETDFYKKYQNQMDSIINNIADWIDKDTRNSSGGNEDHLYNNLPYKVKNDYLDTLEELHLIAGMTDEFYSFFEPSLTIFGEGKMNINTASPLILKSISVSFNDNDIVKIIGARPFAEVKDFNDFVVNSLLKTADFNKNPEVLLTTGGDIFKIESVAQVGNATKRIVMVMDRTLLDSKQRPLIYYFHIH